MKDIEIWVIVFVATMIYVHFFYYFFWENNLNENTILIFVTFKGASVVTAPDSNNQLKEPIKKATKEDTNPNAVLKQITANYIKMDPAALPKAKKILEQVR